MVTWSSTTGSAPTAYDVCATTAWIPRSPVAHRGGIAELLTRGEVDDADLDVVEEDEELLERPDGVAVESGVLETPAPDDAAGPPAVAAPPPLLVIARTVRTTSRINRAAEPSAMMRRRQYTDGG
ncbi:MAG: hypothetical protein ABI345_15620 [Jatrophihabitans sp.]